MRTIPVLDDVLAKGSDQPSHRRHTLTLAVKALSTIHNRDVKEKWVTSGTKWIAGVTKWVGSNWSLERVPYIPLPY